MGDEHSCRSKRCRSGPVKPSAQPALVRTQHLTGGTGQRALPPSGPVPGIVSLSATTTTLSVSPAVVTYGHEQAARLGVKVRGKNINAMVPGRR
jgi:hypothetical protein